MYRFFTDEVSVKMLKLLQLEEDSSLWGNRGKERDAFKTLAKALSRMNDQQRRLLLAIAQRMAGRNRS